MLSLKCTECGSELRLCGEKDDYYFSCSNRVCESYGYAVTWSDLDLDNLKDEKGNEPNFTYDILDSDDFPITEVDYDSHNLEDTIDVDNTMIIRNVNIGDWYPIYKLWFSIDDLKKNEVIPSIDLFEILDSCYRVKKNEDIYDLWIVFKAGILDFKKAKEHIDKISEIKMFKL